MIVKVDDSTLSKKDGSRVATTKILVKCDDCGEEKWGRWTNYINKEKDKHYCRSCANKRGITGCKGKTLSEEFRKQASERMKKNNPTKRADVREKISDSLQTYYKDHTGYWYGKKRDEHSEYMKDYMQKVFSTSEEYKDFNPELRSKLISAHRRISQLQKKVYSSLVLAGYKNFELEWEFTEDNITYIVDIVDPKNKIIVEVNGDFWHQNPDKYGPNDTVFGKVKAKDIWKKDAEKKKFFVERGWKYIVVWEHQVNKASFKDFDWDLLLK